MVKRTGWLIMVFALAFALLVTGCGAGGGGDTGGNEQGAGAGAEEEKLSGTIRLDGSSTVYPISQAVAEDFMDEHPDVNVTVGFSGTGGGFKKSTAGEIEISNASRTIKEEEKATAEKNGIEFIELKVAIDGLAVVVNKENDFVDHLTVEELKKIWEPNSKVKYWSDVRKEWPKEEIKLYGPGHDSGTFDYFTEAIVGEAGASRSDYTASEDDNVLVTGVTGDKYSLGYFGYAYYQANQDNLKVVPIDAGSGPVQPTEENINTGKYTPLSRPLYIYVNKEFYQTRPEVKAFVKYYMDHVSDIAPEVGYIPLPDSDLAQEKAKLQ